MITYSELKNRSVKFYPAILLERFSSHRWRNRIRTILFWLLVISFLFILAAQFAAAVSSVSIEFSEWLTQYKFNIRGLFFVFFSIWIYFYMIEVFYFSFYFKKADIDFDVAKLVINSNRKDVTAGFLNSNIGQYTMFRLGIGLDSIQDFLKNRSQIVEDTHYNSDTDKDKAYIDIRDYGSGIYDSDKGFAYFLEKHAITKDLFLGALSWIDAIQWKIRDTERWWSRDRLSRVPSIGANWSFGQVYLIEKYGKSIILDDSYNNLGDRWRIHLKDVQNIERVLIKNSGANIMLLSQTAEAGMEIVASVGKMITNGKITTELENHRIFVLDTLSLAESSNDVKQLETNFLNILTQANNAGNVVLVIPQFSNFVDKTHDIGMDVVSLMSEFLSSAQIKIIAISNKRGFHQSIETNYGLMQHFEKVAVENVDLNVGIRVLEDEAHYLERKHRVTFTYPSLVEIAKAGDRYFSGSNYADKIIDILEEVSISVASDRRGIIFVDDVQKIVTAKTGVPSGRITEDEKQKLGSLEDILHKRVIGQNEAIDAIADSMRRSRAGITNPNRPIGSFLFLGPTGVGKTETTKALAESFFKSEDKIIRLDMSEFTGPDAVNKLIGSFELGLVGVLAQKLRDQQYGVLLLDEFEKTTGAVMDLFLQISDEGEFTDSRGEKINARNLIIVATSNAASDKIYKGGVSNKDEVINEIINRKIFKPELLNRFDRVVLFHPLTANNLNKISGLMLNKLNKRLSDQGIQVEVTDDLLEYLGEIGNDKKFGARAMNRAIQDVIEKMIADKIIAGELRSGGRARFVKNTEGKLEITVI